jgi:predicted nucleotide-binding protein (sugar kinase/HSP70/actin superfamily)
MIKIGIPRALLYYQYYPMWRTFFGELGAEVVVSPITTQAMLSEGSSRVVADTCLPVKAFVGHVLSLVGNCDYIFIPAIRSVRRNIYNCSKFLGLPDMTRAVVPESPPILDPDVDINKRKRRLYQAIYQVGRLFTWNPHKVRSAAMTAWQAQLSYHQMMSDHKLTPPQALETICNTSEIKPKIEVSPLSPARATIAVIGHPYLLYDQFISHRLIHRLEQAHNKVLTPEMVATEELESAVIRVMGSIQWTCEDEVVGAGEHYLSSGVDGVINVMPFGCGPDSLMMDVVRRRAARLGNTPFMNLVIDEHTSQVGIITRLEAFLDMIYRKKRERVEACG